MPKASYYWKHKERLIIEAKKYRQKHKHTPHAKKLARISHWRNRGCIADFDSLYEIYIESTHCEYCGDKFKDDYDRCMDHCHVTGAPRAILCRGCNIKDPFKNEFL
tara:strand:+ start:948 stop:1265 length:318 start_codon:yes stop_codon:yes gene_type:complete